jgi:hypothetical protein
LAFFAQPEIFLHLNRCEVATNFVQPRIGRVVTRQLVVILCAYDGITALSIVTLASFQYHRSDFKICPHFSPQSLKKTMAKKTKDTIKKKASSKSAFISVSHQK